MDIAITARGLDITDRFREYSAEKAEKVAALATRAIALDIKVTRHAAGRGSAGDDRVELTLVGPGPLVRARRRRPTSTPRSISRSGGWSSACVRARIAGRSTAGATARSRSARPRPTASSVVDIVPASADVLTAVATGSIPIVAEEEAEWSPVVIRSKLFAPAVLTADEAVDHMELVGHDFFSSSMPRPTVRASSTVARAGPTASSR